MTDVLTISGLHKHFGGIVVANDVNLTIQNGEVVGLIGPNGAGKTSLFNIVCGFIAQDAGIITLNGQSIELMPMHVRARLGLSRTWQNIRLFPSLSVLDNLIIAPRNYPAESFLRSVFGSGQLREEGKKIMERALKQLEKVHLVEAASRLPTELSYGKQKLVSIARALMNDGDCLLLDEPIAGVEGAAYEALKNVIRSEAQSGRAICIVEHNISFVKDLCDRVLFMFNGKILDSGTIEELMAKADLTGLYFGSDN
jgi:ABC-type branched-subunit amino acid transport system ATPase component